MCLCWLSACQTLRIVPGTTQVEDTPQTREVLARMEEYRKAVLDQAHEKLLGMAHPSYYSHRGTTDTKDDFLYTGLKRHLDEKISNYVSKVSAFTIRYDSIIFSKIPTVPNATTASERVVERADVLFGYELHFTLTYAMGLSKEREAAIGGTSGSTQQGPGATSRESAQINNRPRESLEPVTQEKSVKVDKKKAVFEKKDGIWYFVEGM